jgi:hypothetical protein
MHPATLKGLCLDGMSIGAAFDPPIGSQGWPASSPRSKRLVSHV